MSTSNEANLVAKIRLIEENSQAIDKMIKEIKDLLIQMQSLDRATKSTTATLDEHGNTVEANSSALRNMASTIRGFSGAIKNNALEVQRYEQELNKMHNTASKAGSPINLLDKNMGIMSKTTSTATVNTKELGSAISTSVAAYSAAAISAFSLYNAWDNLEKVAQRVERAQLSAARAQTTLTTLEAQYTKQKEAGNLSSEQALLMEQKIADARQQVAVYTQDAEIAQRDQNEVMIGFALQVIPFAVTAAVSFNQMLTTLKSTEVKSIITTEALSGAFTKLGISMRTVMLVGAPLLAIGVIVTALATNFMGFRDAVNDLGEAIGNAIPGLMPILEILGRFNEMLDITSGKVDSTAGSLSSSFDTMNSSVGSSISGMTSDIQGFSSLVNKEFDDVLQTIIELSNKIKEEKGTSIAEQFSEERLTIPIQIGEVPEEQLISLKNKAASIFGEGVEIQVSLPVGAIVNQAKTLSTVITKAAEEAGVKFQDFFGEDQPQIDKLHEKINGLGGVLMLANEEVALTTTQVKLLAQALNVDEEGLIEYFRKFIPVVDSASVPLDGHMIRIKDMTLAEKQLEQQTVELTQIFGNHLSSMFGLSQVYMSTGQVIEKLQQHLLQSGLSIEAVEKIIGSLEGKILDSMNTMNESVNLFIADLKATKEGELSLKELADRTKLHMTDVTSAYDVAGEKVHDSMDIFKAWATDTNTNTTDVLTAIENMSRGVFAPIAGMNDITQEAMMRLRQWFQEFRNTKEGQKILADLGNDMEGTLQKIADNIEDSFASFDDMREHLLQTEQVTEQVVSHGESWWNTYKQAIFNATDPQQIQEWINQLEVMKSKEGIDPSVVQLYEFIIEKLTGVKTTMENTNEAQKSLSESSISHAEAMGVDIDVITQYQELLDKQGSLTNEQIINLNNETLTRQELNDGLLTEEELRIRLQLAQMESSETLKEMQLNYELLQQQEQTELENGAKLLQHYQVEFPAGLQYTAENIDLVIRAHLGLAGAEEELQKKLIDSAGGLTAVQQAELDMTNQVEQTARSLGVSRESLIKYNNAKDASGIVTQDLRLAMIGETQAALRSGQAHRFNTLTTEQMALAELTAEQRFDMFAQTVQVEAIESTRYAQILADALIRMGMAASEAYALVSASISAAEDAYRNLSGVPNVKMPDLDEVLGGGKGGGGSSKPKKLTKEEKEDIREQAVQDAIDEAGAVDHLVDKLIEETEAVHELGLQVGLSRKQMEDFADRTNEFGIASDRARIEMLKLIEAEAKHLDFLTNSNTVMKDYLRANIDGTLAANDFVREIKNTGPALEAQREQLLNISNLLGIKLPDSLKPTIENLEDLVAAAYGSEEAMESLKDSVAEVGSFYREVIDDAKKAIEDANFEEFVKKELLFENVGDDFFRNITREIQREMKLDAIAEQMRKQLGLLQLNPDMFRLDVNPEELRSGVLSTIQAIEDAVSGNERLEASWKPILDALNETLTSPDIHDAVQGFADMFPNMIEPALTGVDFALQGIDTSIEETFDDTANESVRQYGETLDELSDIADKLERALLKAAKAANEASGGGGLGGLGDVADISRQKMLIFDDSLKRVPPSMGQIIAANEVMAGRIPAEIAALPEKSKPSWTQMQIDAIATFAAMGKSFDDLPPRLQQVAQNLPPPVKEALGIMEVDTAEGVGSIGQEFGGLEGSVNETGGKMGQVWDETLGMFVDKTNTGVADMNTEFGVLPPGVKTTADDASTKYGEGIATTKQLTTDAVIMMAKEFYVLVEFMVNDVNPAILRAVEKGFGQLPPVVTKTVGLIKIEYNKIVLNTQTTMTSVAQEFEKGMFNANKAVEKWVSEIQKAILDTIAAAKKAVAGIEREFNNMKKDYYITVHVGLSGPGKAYLAEGGSFIATKETHLTVGEGSRPELVTVIPLVGDTFRNKGKEDMSLGLDAVADQINSPMSGVQSNVSPLQQQIVLSAGATNSGGNTGNRVIVLNINQPINIDGTNVGRNIVSKSFEDVDNQI